MSNKAIISRPHGCRSMLAFGGVWVWDCQNQLQNDTATNRKSWLEFEPADFHTPLASGCPKAGDPNLGDQKEKRGDGDGNDDSDNDDNGEEDDDYDDDDDDDNNYDEWWMMIIMNGEWWVVNDDAVAVAVPAAADGEVMIMAMTWSWLGLGWFLEHKPNGMDPLNLADWTSLPGRIHTFKGLISHPKNCKNQRLKSAGFTTMTTCSGLTWVDSAKVQSA